MGYSGADSTGRKELNPTFVTMERMEGLKASPLNKMRGHSPSKLFSCNRNEHMS
jgi:hypothetical protein